MKDPNLVLICAIAFVAVIGLLGFLALMTKAILWLFPAAPSPVATANTSSASRTGFQGPAPEEVAAIHSAVHALAPGWRVVRIEPSDRSNPVSKSNGSASSSNASSKSS